MTIMLSKHASSHVSIAVDCMSLFESSISFAHYMFQNPRRALQLLDDAFQKIALNISKNHVLRADMMYKENLHVRLIALPNLPEVYRSNLPNCSDVGQFLCISGTVVRASTAKMLQYKKQWRCGKCKYQFIVEAKVEQGYVCEKPVICNNPEWCNGKNFTLMSTDINAEWCKDYQEIKMQEQVYNLNVGNVPKSMWVVLEDDLVESCHPGNDVIVSGALIQQWKPLSKGGLIDIQLVILAHNIEVQNKMSSGVISKDMAKEFGQFWQDHKQDPLKGRNFILSSICPQVFGLYIVKLSVALVLAGGVQKRSGSSRIRGDTHLLLIGDPGTAKSQFLKFATKVSSRSVLTSGIGTTNAGLTVSAVKESSRWELEAGALVLADGGICCIDEFSCIKEQDKTCIHEAMEQQTISVAKAGLVCSLNTRCSILAATNPKGKYDENMSISENTALGSPLLSRFDIILVLLDSYDERWDDMVASYILNGRNIINENKNKLWSAAKVKNYFTLIRHINPKVNADAERVLRAYYTRQRSLQSRHASRTTPRLLQSLIRLAEGHARLMFRTEVLVTDAVIAIILVESSMLGNSILEGLSPLHTVFPDNPMAEYLEKAEKVFQNLNIFVSAEKNYECFYEESVLNSLLSDISAEWNPKEDPFIFGSPSCDKSSITDQFQERVIDTSEIATSELQNFEDTSENIGNIFYSTAKESNYSSQMSSLVQKVVMAEVHENSNGTATNIFQNQISTLSDLKNMFGDEMTDSDADASEDVFKKKAQASKNTQNLSILDQILEEADFDMNNSTAPNSSHNELPRLKNIFNNPKQQATTSENKMATAQETFLESEEMSQEKIANTQPERSSTDILEQLGISPEKELTKNGNNSAGSLTEISCSFPNNKPINVGNIFPPKRSIADQLKNFTFKRSRVSTQNFPNHESIASITEDKQKNSSILGTDELKNKHSDRTEKGENQYSSKKFVFNMIKNKCKNIYDKNNEDLPSTSKILDHINTVNNSNILMTEMANEGSKTIQEPPKIELNDYQVNRDGPSSTFLTSIDQPEPVMKKKPIPDRLKMFAFSKIKSSKTQHYDKK